MKKMFCLWSIVILFFSSVAQAAETYTFDPTHTYVLWHISHFGFSEPSGKWMANGTLVLDPIHPKNSHLQAKIQVGDIVTGIPKLDEHLKSKDFFDVAQFPEATFVSDKVNQTGQDTATILGHLTLHGVTRPVILNVKLNKIGISPIDQKKTAGFTATTKINRSDFGMMTYLPGLGDEVKLEIEVEGKLT